MKIAIPLLASLTLLVACSDKEKPVPQATTSSSTANTAGLDKAAADKESRLAQRAWSNEITSAEAERTRAECVSTAEITCVTLKVTGMAYLVGTKADATRTLVVPKVPQHETLILTENNRSGLSDHGLLKDEKPQKKEGDPAFSRTFFFRKFPSAVEIDLEASGWTKPSPPVLVADEPGDPAAVCPKIGPPSVPKESLHWLPHLATVSKHPTKPTIADLDDAFIRKDPDDKKVITRLEFSDGRLTAEMAGGPIGKFQFTRNGTRQPDDHEQTIATFLRYRFPAKLEAVTLDGQTENLFVLRGRPFKGKESKEVIARFKPDANGNIEIVLANTVDFFFLKPPQKVEHLPHAYKIFKNDAVAATVPERIARCPAAPGDSGVECGPLRVP